MSSSATSRQINDLVECARDVLIFRNDGGQPFAVLPTMNGESNTVWLRSARFQAWLSSRFYLDHDRVPQPAVMRTAINILDMRAGPKGARFPDASLRIGAGPAEIRRQHPDGARTDEKRPAIGLDLADPYRDRILEISATGWDINSESQFYFLRPLGTMSIPNPDPAAEPADLAALRDLLRFSPRDWLRTLAWLLASFRPHGPYPILVLQGPAGSGKSLAARLLRTLVDPVAAPLAPLPATAHAVSEFARTNRILAFDHVTAVNRSVSTALCQISSGAAFYDPESPRTDPILVAFSRPILITTPTTASGNFWHPRPDLADRILTVTVPALTPQDRRTESELLQTFEAARPRCLGALANAVSAAIARRTEVHLDSYPRLPDTAVWAVAASPQTGCTPGEMLAALDAPSAFALPRDPLPDALRAFMSARDRWQGTATQLLGELALPIPVNQLTHHLRELQLDGISIAWQRKAEIRLVLLEKNSPPLDDENSRHAVMPSSAPTKTPQG